jgi:hypothetical protein
VIARGTHDSARQKKAPPLGSAFEILSAYSATSMFKGFGFSFAVLRACVVGVKLPECHP